MRRVAIYDLDKTLTRKATFTPFLVFTARRVAPWRLALLPVWVGAMAGYKAKLYSRTALKTFGLKIMVGRISRQHLAEIGASFAQHQLADSGTKPVTARLLEEDRQAGADLAIATAAFRFYAEHFAAHLGIRHVIATEWDGREIPHGNCYGEEKYRRVMAWLARNIGARETFRLRFVSDSFADAPLLDEADDAILISADASTRRKAERRGWRAMSGLL